MQKGAISPVFQRCGFCGFTTTPTVSGADSPSANAACFRTDLEAEVVRSHLFVWFRSTTKNGRVRLKKHWRTAKMGARFLFVCIMFMLGFVPCVFVPWKLTAGVRAPRPSRPHPSPPCRTSPPSSPERKRERTREITRERKRLLCLNFTLPGMFVPSLPW